MPETPEAGGGWIDEERFRAVATDCDWTVGELTRFFVSGTHDQLDELREALAAGEAGEVERLAHSCIGSAATCGIDGLVGLLRRLEGAARGGEIGDCRLLLAAVERRMEEIERALGALAAE